MLEELGLACSLGDFAEEDVFFGIGDPKFLATHRWSATSDFQEFRRRQGETDEPHMNDPVMRFLEKRVLLL